MCALYVPMLQFYPHNSNRQGSNDVISAPLPLIAIEILPQMMDSGGIHCHDDKVLSRFDLLPLRRSFYTSLESVSSSTASLWHCKHQVLLLISKHCMPIHSGGSILSSLHCKLQVILKTWCWYPWDFHFIVPTMINHFVYHPMLSVSRWCEYSIHWATIIVGHLWYTASEGGVLSVLITRQAEYFWWYSSESCRKYIIH